MRTAARAPSTVVVIWSLALLGAGFLPGCGLFRKDKPIGHVTATPAPVDLTQAAISGADQFDAGLEVNLVVSTADRARLAGALSPYLEAPPGVDSRVLDLWKANGLRLVRVPLSDWPRLSQEMRLSGATQRQWVGQTTGWSEVVRGPERPRGQTIALEAERLELGPGRLRILGRCWLAPVVPAGADGGVVDGSGVPATLNLELVPQHRDSIDPAKKLSIGVSPISTGVERPDDGLLFSRLQLTMSVRRGSDDVGGGWAYVLVAERPNADWHAVLASRPLDDGSTEVSDVAVLGHQSPGLGEVKRNERGGDSAALAPGGQRVGPAGPDAPSVPTLGEALFGRDVAPSSSGDSEGPAQAEPAARAMVVLIPRVPATYRLIAPATPAKP